MGSKPAREDETPSAGVSWKLLLLVAGIIGAAFVGGMLMQGDGDSAKSVDATDTSTVDVGQGHPAVVNGTTATAEASPSLTAKDDNIKVVRKFTATVDDMKEEIASIRKVGFYIFDTNPTFPGEGSTSYGYLVLPIADYQRGGFSVDFEGVEVTIQARGVPYVSPENRKLFEVANMSPLFLEDVSDMSEFLKPTGRTMDFSSRTRYAVIVMYRFHET